MLEALPRTRCHLDVWASNAARRPDGTVALFDWSFCGDGARGEDIGNQVPDGVFDLFWPAERMAELETAVFGAYLDGLRLAGWDGDHREVRLAMTASCVKYAWLLPQMLAEADRPGGPGLLARGRAHPQVHRPRASAWPAWWPGATRPSTWPTSSDTDRSDPPERGRCP